MAAEMVGRRFGRLVVQRQGANRRNNRWIEFDGKKMTLSQWGRKTGLGTKLLHKKLKSMSMSEVMQCL